MIEIVAGDRVPDLPFVIVNREGCHVDLTGITPTDRSGEHVGDEEADGLGLQILVGACGAFVAVLRNHAEIVLAHADRESQKSAALPFPQGSHSLGRRRHGGFSLRRGR
jgi:hypothetical protein